MVYCRTAVKEFRKLTNPSAWDLSRKSQIPSSNKFVQVLGGPVKTEGGKSSILDICNSEIVFGCY